MNNIKIGYIGLGCRGKDLLENIVLAQKEQVTAVCDVYEDRAQEGAKVVEAAGQPTPFVSTDYKEIIANEEVNTVIIATAWESHVEIALAAMYAGKAVAMEVGGAYSLEDCYKLVDAYEKTKTPFMFLENCCFGRRELMVLNMVEQGVLGEIVHCAGGYQHDLRDELGYIPQKGVLFSGTIESNILYGNPDGSEAEMKKAAEIAQATEFIEEKHKKYNSPIAQGGSNVSGGQKQRLSIARAIAKNPKVYIFDDSFSALDYKTDVALRAALKENTQDSTVIIVAQRISTILHAEQIIVLDDGEVAGIGTHKELLKSCEAYYQIASSQLSETELARDLNDETDGKEEA